MGNMYLTLLGLMVFSCVSFREADTSAILRPNMQPKSEALSESSKLLLRTRRGLVPDKGKANVTAAERLLALALHNKLRGKVSPSAADMIFMTWNHKLESMAQEWADGCHYDHGNPTRADPPFSRIGQNLWVHTSGHDIENAIQMWYDEVDFYTHSTKHCVPDKVCGHYTQVAWAKTREVGCGIKYCPKTKGFGDKAAYYIVCNYGPAGNFVGQSIYQSGTSCGSCPSTHPTCESNLCREKPLCKSKTCAPNGVVYTDTCECKCEGDYYGSSCEKHPSNVTASTGDGNATDDSIASTVSIPPVTNINSTSTTTETTVTTEVMDVPINVTDTTDTSPVTDTVGTSTAAETMGVNIVTDFLVIGTTDTAEVTETVGTNTKMDTSTVTDVLDISITDTAEVTETVGTNNMMDTSETNTTETSDMSNSTVISQMTDAADRMSTDTSNLTDNGDKTEDNGDTTEDNGDTTEVTDTKDSDETALSEVEATPGDSKTVVTTDWSDWSTCSVTCSNGVKSRQKLCHASTVTVLDCESPSSQTIVCFELPCEGNDHFIGFDISFRLTDRTFDPLLNDVTSLLYNDLLQTITMTIIDNSEPLVIHAIRNMRFTEGSVVVDTQLVTSNETSVDNVTQLLTRVASSDSAPFDVARESISVSDPVEMTSFKDPGAVGVCAGNPCQHFGSCVDHGSTYTCNCLYGRTGVNCEKENITRKRWSCMGDGCFVEQLEAYRQKMYGEAEYITKIIFVVVAGILVSVLFILIGLLVIKCLA